MLIFVIIPLMLLAPAPQILPPLLKHYDLVFIDLLEPFTRAGFKLPTSFRLLLDAGNPQADGSQDLIRAMTDALRFQIAYEAIYVFGTTLNCIWYSFNIPGDSSPGPCSTPTTRRGACCPNPLARICEISRLICACLLRIAGDARMETPKSFISLLSFGTTYSLHLLRRLSFPFSLQSLTASKMESEEGRLAAEEDYRASVARLKSKLKALRVAPRPRAAFSVQGMTSIKLLPNRGRAFIADINRRMDALGWNEPKKDLVEPRVAHEPEDAHGNDPLVDTTVINTGERTN
ncbi:hypothetical protein C8J57DRAFT_1707665 [Mycena rebaudengoi]|nr:hypothetical protein C8J57DRAFT_1707665 [Mycena rebaudengoi]